MPYYQKLKILTDQLHLKIFDFFNKMYPYADVKTISKIRYARKPLSFFETLKTALNEYKIKNNVISCVIGEIENSDFVPEIADMLVGIKEIRFSIVCGTINSKNIISVRTSIESLNMGKLLSKAIGKKGTAGGHDMIAAGQFTGSPNVVIKDFVELISKQKY